MYLSWSLSLSLLFGQVLPPQDADQMTIVLDRYLKVFSKCLFGHVMSLHSSSSQGSAFEGVLKMHFVFVFVFFCQIMSSHHSDQMSQFSKVSRIAL